MPTLDLLDRLLEHDAWTTRRVLDFAETLADKQLDRQFDIGHRTIRETLHHMIGNVEVWTDLMLARPVRRAPPAGQPIADLRQRFDTAFGEFARAARGFRGSQRLGEMYMDVLDKPPREKSIAGTVLHVVTHDHMHRAEILHMLERLGVQGLIEGDVLSWEGSSGRYLDGG